MRQAEKSFIFPSELPISQQTSEAAIHAWHYISRNMDVADFTRNPHSAELSWIPHEVRDVLRQSADHMGPKEYKHFLNGSVATLLLVDAKVRQKEVKLQIVDPDVAIEDYIGLISMSLYEVLTDGKRDRWERNERISPVIKQHVEKVWDEVGERGLEEQFYMGVQFGYDMMLRMFGKEPQKVSDPMNGSRPHNEYPKVILQATSSKLNINNN